MVEHEPGFSENEGMMRDLRHIFLSLETPQERVAYIIEVQDEMAGAISEPESLLLERFVRWAFEQLTDEEAALMQSELGKRR